LLDQATIKELDITLQLNAPGPYSKSLLFEAQWIWDRFKGHCRWRASCWP